jgi:hypothetical protein
MHYDPNTWGPHYWFFLMTIAMTYPKHPNDAIKRKYYDLIQNMPIFIPSTEIGNKFSEYLDKYPVTPYLTNRDSFIHWVYFIHNRINYMTGKEEISYDAAIEKYLAEYRPKQISLSEKFKIQKKYILLAFLMICFFFILYYTDK